MNGNNLEKTKRVATFKQKIIDGTRVPIHNTLERDGDASYGPHGVLINGQPFEYNGETEFEVVFNMKKCDFLKILLKNNKYILVNDMGDVFQDKEFDYIGIPGEDELIIAQLQSTGKEWVDRLNPDFDNSKDVSDENPKWVKKQQDKKGEEILINPLFEQVGPKFKYIDNKIVKLSLSDNTPGRNGLCDENGNTYEVQRYQSDKLVDMVLSGGLRKVEDHNGNIKYIDQVGNIWKKTFKKSE